eukprot:4208791-Alexandrium_andersonii.AAC.1
MRSAFPACPRRLWRLRDPCRTGPAIACPGGWYAGPGHVGGVRGGRSLQAGCIPLALLVLSREAALAVDI